jgi:hypothetical protein
MTLTLPSNELSTKIGAGAATTGSGGVGWGLLDMAKAAEKAASPKMRVSVCFNARKVMP